MYTNKSDKGIGAFVLILIAFLIWNDYQYQKTPEGQEIIKVKKQMNKISQERIRLKKIELSTGKKFPEIEKKLDDIEHELLEEQVNSIKKDSENEN